MSANAELRPLFILCFHNVFLDEVDTFKHLIDSLDRDFEFISYSKAINLQSEYGQKPYLAFSFDDGYKNNFAAAEILARYGISACFFVCPYLLENRSSLEHLEFNKKKLGNPPIEFLDWNQLSTMKNMGHEIGNHTYSHCRVSTETEDKVEEEILVARDLIVDKMGECKHFAWPYGMFKDFSEVGRKVVFESGHISCASAVRGYHIPIEEGINESLCIRRQAFLGGPRLQHVYYFFLKSLLTEGKATTFPY